MAPRDSTARNRLGVTQREDREPSRPRALPSRGAWAFGDPVLLRGDAEDEPSAEELERLRDAVGQLQRHVALLERTVGGGRFEFDAATARLTLSPRARRLLGLSESSESFAPAEWLQAIDPEHHGVLATALQSVLDGRATGFSIDVRIVEAGEPLRWVTWRAEVGLSSPDSVDAALRSVVGVVDDTTGNRDAEADHRRVSRIVRVSPHPVMELDEAGEVVYFNPATRRLMAAVGVRRPTELLPKDHHLLALGALDRNQDLRNVEVLVAGRALSWVYHPDPVDRTVHLHGQDVTDRREAERELRRSRERYVLAAEGSRDGLWDWNLDTDEVYYSDRWQRMVGMEPGRAGAGIEEWLDRVHRADLPRVRRALDEHLEGRTEHCEVQHRIRHEDGAFRWVLVRGAAAREPGGRAYRMAGSLSDITERKEAERRLAYSAFHDALTGLPNRTHSLDRLNRTLRRARHGGRTFAVLFLDLDRFKFVNDSLGHTIGDQLLVSFSRRLERCLRPGDVIARLGGDEFTVMLEPPATREEAIAVADRIHRALEAPFQLAGFEVFTSVSIGITLCPGGYEQAEEILRDADSAMYRAKSNGRARHEVFDAEMRDRAMSILRLDGEMRRALERRAFRLVYQPIIDLQTGRIEGFEALARWSHPERGAISPAEFIPVAEETGLIVPLGEFVMGEAAAQLRRWLDAGSCPPSLSMSINISRQQVMRGGLHEVLQRTIERTGVPAANLALEVTESAIIGNTEEAAAQLRELRQLGVRIHMDDFGTGWSSLSHLHRLPIDTLKIDRAFVRHMGSGDAAIVRTIIDLGRSLGMGVIAEGVETEDQLARLRALGCGWAQGYFFSRPLGAPDSHRLIAQRQRW